MLILLFLILSPTLIYFLFLHKLKQQEHDDKIPFRPPPGPKGLPFIGNLLQFDFSKPHEYFANLGKVYGPIIGLRLGHVPVVVVQSAKLAKEVLQTQDLNFCNRPSFVGMRKLSYNGLDVTFAPYGDYFREIKKLCVVHLLSSKRVESFRSIRQEEVSRLIEKVAMLASTSQVINLGELLTSFAISNICRTAFGKRYEDYEEEGSRSRFHSLLEEVQATIVGFYFTDYFPYLGWLDKLTGQLSKLDKVFKDYDMFYDEIINDHLDPNRPKTQQHDFVDVLLQIKRQPPFAFELTFDHIKGILTNIFVAGVDTSAAMTVWAMTELVKNANSLKNVQNEVRNAAGNKGYIVEEDLKKLEYFKAVVKETLRLHPAAPLLIVRETVRKTTLNGYTMLPKTLVHVNAWAIGRDQYLWKDSEAFMPERFLGCTIDYKGQDFEFVPFGAGRRICPGMALGVANLELSLANLLCCFDWELPFGLKKEDIDTDVILGLSMHKKNPLCLRAKKVSHS